MDLFKLDGLYHPTGVVVDGYSSLIWTERYGKLGDFVLKTDRVSETKRLLPVRSLVSIRESRQVMIVENHLEKPSESDEEYTELTVTGRTFESILEKRAMVFNDDPQSPNYSIALPGVYLENLINSKIALTNWPVAIPLAENVAEAISKCHALNTTQGNPIFTEQSFPDPTPGQVYPVVANILSQFNLGISSTRPDTFYPELGQDDLVVKIYYGTNRSLVGNDAPTPEGGEVQTSMYVNDPVVFNLDDGDIEGYSSLLSIKDYYNVAYVCSPLGFREVYAVPISDRNPLVPVGIERKVLQVDASDLTDPGNIPVEQALDRRGALELAKFNGAALIDGTISDTSKKTYNVDYFLGDKVSLVGKSGASGVRRISEYIRSEDITGERHYPTLVEVSENMELP